MTPSEVLDRIAERRLVMVVRAASAADALRAVAAAKLGGIRVVEITFTVPDAQRVIRELARDTELIVGAGTVRTTAHVVEAIEAGAMFLVSPGLDEAALAEAGRRGVLMVPGILTPSEAMRAADLGAEAIKLFPASTVGPDYLRALLAPLPELHVIPSGGISAGNAGEWLAAGAIAVGMAGQLSPRGAVGAEAESAITQEAQRSVTAVSRSR